MVVKAIVDDEVTIFNEILKEGEKDYTGRNSAWVYYKAHALFTCMTVYFPAKTTKMLTSVPRRLTLSCMVVSLIAPCSEKDLQFIEAMGWIFRGFFISQSESYSLSVLEHA